MKNVISIVPAINAEKLKSELVAVQKIEDIAKKIQIQSPSDKAKMIEHTAKYLRKLILEM